MNKMQQDHQKYCRQIEYYNNNILNLEQSQKRQQISFHQNVERQRKNCETIHVAEVSTLSKKLQDLQTEYFQLKKFEQLQKQYNAKIQKLKNTFVQEQYKHHDAMNEKQRYQKQQTLNAQIRNQAQTKTVIKQVHKEAKTKVINQHKQAMGQKMQLKSQLLVLHKQLQKLKKISNSIATKNKQTKIKATINIQSLQQYRAVGALQIAKIKNFKQKTQQIKTRIANESQKSQKELYKIKSENNQKLEELKKIYKLNKKQKQSANRQLDDIKILASKIIQQRVQLEQFFTTAISRLQKEGQKNKKQGDKIYGDKVDVTELDIIDKQKILKTLLSKISTGGREF